MSNKVAETKHAVVLFDGVCHLCQGAVKFIIKRDPRGRFRFASLQSVAGEQLLENSNVPADHLGGHLGTIVLVDNGVYYTHSTAVLRIAKGLRFPWPLFYGFILVPRFLRDGVYRWIAARRYRFFGKDETCLVPTKDIKERFL